jgi:hypothetical protein
MIKDGQTKEEQTNKHDDKNNSQYKKLEESKPITQGN